jgi:hypothetical protein
MLEASVDSDDNAKFEVHQALFAVDSLYFARGFMRNMCRGNIPLDSWRPDG